MSQPIQDLLLKRIVLSLERDGCVFVLHYVFFLHLSFSALLAPLGLLTTMPSSFSIVPSRVGKFGSIPLGVLPHAVDPQTADRLWRLSEHLTSTSFGIAGE